MTFLLGNRRARLGLASAFFTLMAAAPGAARCALGDTLDTVQAEGSAAHAVVRSQQLANFSVHSLSLSTGVQVNEYADASGHVFAVTWRGQTIPDLSQYLGAYFLDYSAGRPAADARTGHRFMVLHSSRVVVVMGGQMRDLWGRAYLPGGVPAGVSLSEVR